MFLRALENEREVGLQLGHEIERNVGQMKWKSQIILIYHLVFFQEEDEEDVNKIHSKNFISKI